MRVWAATGIVVCWSVCLFVCPDSESAYLAAIALRLQNGYPSHNKLLVLKVTDFDVKASLSNKS